MCFWKLAYIRRCSCKLFEMRWKYLLLPLSLKKHFIKTNLKRRLHIKVYTAIQDNQKDKSSARSTANVQTCSFPERQTESSLQQVHLPLFIDVLGYKGNVLNVIWQIYATKESETQIQNQPNSSHPNRKMLQILYFLIKAGNVLNFPW